MSVVIPPGARSLYHAAVHRITRFFHSIWAYLSSPAAYREIHTRPLSSLFGYLYALYVLIALTITVPGLIALWGLLPNLNTHINNFKQDAFNLYPPELVLTVEDGELTTNMEEPIVIEFPERWTADLSEKEKNDPDNPFKHFITIDTSLSAEDYTDTESVILITKRAIVGKDDNTTRAFLFADLEEDFTVNHVVYTNFLRQVEPYLGFIVPLLSVAFIVLFFLAPFSIALFSTVFAMVWLLVLTLILMIFNALMWKGYGYKQLYKLGMVGYTIPALLALFMNLFDMRVIFVPSLVFLGWMAYVLHKLPGVLPLAGASPVPPTPAPVPSAPPPPAPLIPAKPVTKKRPAARAKKVS
jgi:hypothetical protein